MACCNDPRMKDLNHVRILAQAYSKNERVDVSIFKTNVPPIGEAYNFTEYAHRKDDLVEIVRFSDNSGGTVLSDNVNRKSRTTRKPISSKTKEEVLPEFGGTSIEVSGNTGDLLSENRQGELS